METHFSHGHNLVAAKYIKKIQNVLMQFVHNGVIGLDLAWTMNFVELKKSEPVDISFYTVKHGTNTIL